MPQSFTKFIPVGLMTCEVQLIEDSPISRLVSGGMHSAPSNPPSDQGRIYIDSVYHDYQESCLQPYQCSYCGGSTLACCEHSSDSAEELNKRVREGAD